MPPDLLGSPLSQGDLTILQQLHCRIRSLEVRVKNYERLLKAKDVMIRNVQEEIVQRYRKQKDDVSMLFNAARTFDARLEDLEAIVPPKTPAFVSMEDLNVIAQAELVQDENQSPVPHSLSQNLLNNPTANLAHRPLSLPILSSLFFCFLCLPWPATIAVNSNFSQSFLLCAGTRSGHFLFLPKHITCQWPVIGPKLSTVVSLATLQEKLPQIPTYRCWKCMRKICT